MLITSTTCYTFLGPHSNLTAQQSSPTKTAIKLDFPGLTYIEKFKDKSSQEYKKMADDIKNQVK